MVISQRLLPLKNGKGRIPVYEVMHVNTAIRNLIRENKVHQIDSIIATNKDCGMILMKDSIEALMKRKIVNPEEAERLLLKASTLNKKIQ